MDEKEKIENIKRNIQNAQKVKFDPNERARSLDFKTEAEAKEYLENLFIEYSFQCLNEKTADGCYRLANYHENITHRYDEASEIHKKNCDDNDYARSCYHYANARMYGRGD
jgi:hypothetical protein